MCNQCNDSNQEHVHAMRTRREVLKAGAALVAAPFLGGVTSIVQAAEAANTMLPVGRPAYAQAGKVRETATEWLNYAGNKASSKYSPLAQIGRDNFNRLRVAWRWRSADEEIAQANPHLKTWVWEATPLMVGGVLYVSTSMSQVAAIDAATGKTRWVYDPGTWKGGMPSNNGFVSRGVAYWADGNDQRILFGTGDGYLISLNAQTGKPISTFGQEGRIDLTQGLGRPVDRHLYGVSSPPIICRDVVVMGSKVHDFPLVKEMPPGDVRGFDVRSGKQRWLFRSVPAGRRCFTTSASKIRFLKIICCAISIATPFSRSDNQTETSNLRAAGGKTKAPQTQLSHGAPVEQSSPENCSQPPYVLTVTVGMALTGYSGKFENCLGVR